MSNSYSFYSNCGCLQSESTAALEKVNGTSSQEMQLNCNYDQTHLHDLSDTNSLKKIFISKESIHVLKLNTLRKRMIITLNGIQSLLSNRPQPDGVEDLKRRQQRAAEFSARFCRNYLYQLQRQMNNITKMWKNSSVNPTHSSYFILCQKVITTHQNAHLALQAYLHHMPCSVENGVPDKLEELLEVVHSLCCVCSKLDMSEGDSDCNSERVKQQCEQLMRQIKSGIRVEDSESSVTMSNVCTPKGSKTNCKKQMATERYSMYSRNPCRQSSSKQNKKLVKFSTYSKKRLTESHSKRHINESISHGYQKRNVLTSPATHKNHERIFKEDPEVGEVCAKDNIRTMMESFLDKEVPEQNVIPLKLLSPERPTRSNSVQKEKNNQTMTSVDTLKKLETEIKNLKEQTKSLKEMGHPNYSIYIRTLDSMSRQLSRMKLRQQTAHTSLPIISPALSSHPVAPPPMASPLMVSPPVTSPLMASPPITACPITSPLIKTKFVLNKHSNIEFPKNVRLICLNSVKENEPTKTDQKYVTTNKTLMDNAQEIDINCEQLPSLREDKDNLKNVEYVSGSIHVQQDSAQQNVEEPCEQKSRICEKHSLHKLYATSFGEHRNFDTGFHVQHSWAGKNSSEKLMDFVTKFSQIEREPIRLAISQNDKSAALLYHQMFQNYASSNSLYNKSIKPWHMVTRLANRVIDNVLKDVALNDTGIQKITSRLLRLEFQ